MSIDDLLDGLVDPFEARRRRLGRRARRVHTGRADAMRCSSPRSLALLVVPTAVALHGRIADLFQGTPAPPAVSSSFGGMNKTHDLAARKGFGAKFPQAEVAKAHGVLEVQTSDGPLDLWAAPSDQGGQCWWIDFANDPVLPGGRFGFGGCDRGSTLGSDIAPGDIWVEPHPTLMTLYGQVTPPAARVEAELTDGSMLRLPVVEGFFLGTHDRSARLTRVTAYDDAGHVVATFARPS